MSDNSNSNLSFKDFPPHSNGRIHKKLYMPSYDLQFELEMARRASTTKNMEENTDHQEDPDQITDSTAQKPLKFGLIDFQHTEIDEQALEQLEIPDPLVYQPGLERELRSSAIFIYNRSIALLKTEQIISHVLFLLGDRSPTFTHLEWIDDFSCVLAFTTNADAIEAFIKLLIRPDEVEGENGLPEAFAYLQSDEATTEIYAAAYEFVGTHRPAKPFAKDLFEVNPKNKLHQPSRPEQLIPFIRFATTSDVKDSSSRNKSLFYALNGTRAGQEGVLSKTTAPIFSKTNGLPSREIPLLNGRWAHTELPEPRHPLPSRSVRGLLNSSNPRSKRPRPTTSNELDEELDRFMNKTDDVKPLQAESSRTEKKRGREEKEGEDEPDTKQNRRSRKRQAPIPKVLNPSVELLPDRPSNRGGNLKDELFSTVTTNFEDEQLDKKPILAPTELKQESITEEGYAQQSNWNEDKLIDEKPGYANISKTEDREDQELMDVEELDHHQVPIDSSNHAHHLEESKSNDNEASHVPRKPNKKRWGPLFSRLL